MKMGPIKLGGINKPKLRGGMGLKDLDILNKVLSEKIWWWWLKSPNDQWAHLWRTKYAIDTLENHLVQWEEWKQVSNV